MAVINNSFIITHNYDLFIQFIVSRIFLDWHFPVIATADNSAFFIAIIARLCSFDLIDNQLKK